MTDRIAQVAEPAAPQPLTPPAQPAPPAVPEGTTTAAGSGATDASGVADVAGAASASGDGVALPDGAMALPSDGVAVPSDAATGPADGFGVLAHGLEFLDRGGIAMWAIAALSVVTLALILYRFWRLARIGVWRRRAAERAVTLWSQGNHAAAAEAVMRRQGVRSRLVAAAIAAVRQQGGPTSEAREETTRVARRLLAETGGGLRALELIATVAPLLGLFGTVLGMIGAFQALQSAGARADPSALAGGIWEALLTTAAGMAVAIPASAALTWFESIADRVRLDLEDLATRIFTRCESVSHARAAE